MPEPKSFLASVKNEVNTTFATVYDELVDLATDPEAFTASLKKLHKSVWEVMEKRLKESFSNGKKATGTDKPLKERKPNPFHKE